MSPDQASLLDDLIDTDIAAIEAELEALQPAPVEAKVRQRPKRAPLPPQFPRTLIHHEPDNSHCQCGCALKRIGEDASEKLDYTPGVFTVERHIRGKWACEQCETLIQAPVPAHVIDKGIPTAGLLAQIMVAKFADHLPLYRQEKIFGRARLPIARSTLAQWVGITDPLETKARGANIQKCYVSVTRAALPCYNFQRHLQGLDQLHFLTILIGYSPSSFGVANNSWCYQNDQLRSTSTTLLIAKKPTYSRNAT